MNACSTLIYNVSFWLKFIHQQFLNQRMHYLYFLLFAFVCASCNNTTETAGSESTDTTSKENTVENKPGEMVPEPSGTNDACYMQVLKRDTIVLHLTNTTRDNISGKLSFDNYEKDGSTGTVKGKRQGDVLQLIYSFSSEGMNSVMEVYFKEENDGMVRGVGEIQTKGDTAYFVHPDQISYPENGMMRKVSCEQLPAKYR